jgi:hypothetical protein
MFEWPGEARNVRVFGRESSPKKSCVVWTGMRHATAETLQRIEPLLHELRSVPGLVEKRPGIFYRKSKAFLHFHEDPTGLHADVRFADDFERARVETKAERKALMARIRAL